MVLFFSQNDVPSFTKRLGPAHIDLRAWPPLTYEAASWPTQARIEQQVDRDYGQSVTTTRKIPSGKVVVEEHPQVMLLEQSFTFHRCSHCFRKNTSVECRNRHCPWNLYYCSSRCEARHWTSVHRWLCRFPELGKYFDMKEGSSYNAGLTVMMMQAYFTNNQSRMPGLVSNLGKHKAVDKNEYRKKASLVASILNIVRDSAVDELMEIQGQLRCNILAIRENNAVLDGVTEQLGKAVYYSASKINHSCDPNAIAFFGVEQKKDPTLLRIRASRDIAAGKQVCISYGLLACKHALTRREEMKELYFFMCNCEACQRSDVENPASHIYQCQYCPAGKLGYGELRCNRCNRPIDWARIATLEYQAEALMEEGKYVKALSFQKQIYHRHALPWGEALDKVAEQFARRKDYATAAKLVIESLDAVSHTYGEVSIEVSRELMKLSTLLFNIPSPALAQQYVLQAMHVYKALGLDEQIPSEFDELEQMRIALQDIVSAPTQVPTATNNIIATNGGNNDTTSNESRPKLKKKTKKSK
ncbi:hypothetical protein BJV82DRAFT_601983 [Fennellomyces sp. T-0311]|nr:hypothetical protein BJV82DRAFT_601983 [Fennellomyces sp. T-0311]